MPRLTNRIPKYSRHKATGQAVVTLGGRDMYLGPYGSSQSRDEYDRLIAEWIANGRTAPGDEITIADVLVAFWRHAKTYYRKPVLNPDGSRAFDADGKPLTVPTNELDNFRDAMRPLKALYADTPAARFGPVALQSVIDAMVKKGWARTYINRNLGRLKLIFKWAVSKELIPSSVYEAVRTVPGLKRWRSEARESNPVKPVPEDLIEPVRLRVSRQVRGMIDLQLVTGMRPGEVCGMRICHIDMTDPNLWCYRPPHHKTSHHGHERIVFLGKRAQAIIQPFLKPDLTAFVFSPADAERERREQQHARRKTPLSCGNVPGSNRSPTPRKQPGERYTVESYGRAIKNACERAFPMPVDLVEPTGAAAIAKDTPTAKASRAKARREWRARYGWHPHRLRHNFGTWARKEYSLEVAQLLLGQSTIKAAEIYAEKNVAAAQRIMAAVG